jgi:hypothetical protein
VNSTLVPNGLPRDDGKRPGGMTLVPWIKGQPLVWDVTVVRGDQEGLFKLVTLDRILNRITGVTSGCWWLVVVNAIPISIICQINQQNISSCSVINNQIIFFFNCTANVLKSSEVSGFAAEMACKRKYSKYSSIISSNYVFKGLAFETLGPWCKEAIDFINVIGNRLIAESGGSKSKKFLFERISLAIQHGNAASIRGTFPDSAILSEIFVL